MFDEEYYDCSECPYCKPEPEPYQGPGLAKGVKYGICQRSGNMCFLEPWDEKRKNGKVIHNTIDGCGMVVKKKD